MEQKPLPLTNDTAKIVPRTVFDVPELKFDFPSLQRGPYSIPTVLERVLRDPAGIISIEGRRCNMRLLQVL